ncbi:hypothetical protein GCM10025865_19890 [Paraoerskovia sediminicola]|uniref:AAA domain-containing protein n=1 Tax=Paraoerskovia sediminicola TaxID=1138587 RepID=A0ABN6XFX5_9CELL|nr:hypothetical protein [Paraoerskovia sediminicola]BDZ42690.1 hypothetical protein GCM10025865_19890 [Paraoerskovia sediminicola]
MTAPRPTFGAKTLAELARAANGSDQVRDDDAPRLGGPVLVPDPDDADLVRSAVSSWRSSLVELAGGSSLADIERLGHAVLDLSGAHPSGVAQLFAGRPTRLSNIFRETSGAMPGARRRARAVVSRSQEYGQSYGVPATYLAIGVATWAAGRPAPESDDVVALARVTEGAGRTDDAPYLTLANLADDGADDRADDQARDGADERAVDAALDGAEGDVPGRAGAGSPEALSGADVSTVDEVDAAHEADGPDTAATNGESRAGTEPAPLSATGPEGSRVADESDTSRVPDPEAAEEPGSSDQERREVALRERIVRAPVLLRPITVTPIGDGADFELVLEPTLEINPLLARTLRSHGALLDPIALARSTFTSSGFEPDDALNRIQALGEAVLQDFDLGQRVLVGAFVHPGQLLVDDLDEVSTSLERHEVVGAIAGVADAVTSAYHPAPDVAPGDVDPAVERGVGDLDRAQRRVLATVAAGNHVFVDAPAGADVPGTVAAVVADAASRGQSILYVPGHRRAADAMIARLDRLGLGDLVLDVPVTPTWRSEVAERLLGAMSAAQEEPKTSGSDEGIDALLGARSRLAAYIDALHLVREPWQVSAYDALQALARLSSERPVPTTTVRLAASVTLAVGAERRAELARDLEELARLGAFTERARTTPWAGAHLLTDAAADDTLLRVQRVAEQTLPQLMRQVEEVATSTGLEPATSMAEWSDQLTMLGGMRGTLDVFLPEVFERAATDMVHATATRQWRAERGVELGWSQRRRLRKQAKDMVRPGVRVTDLHAALIEVAEQRTVWQQHCPRGGWPTLPPGLAAIEETQEAVRIDLEALSPILADTEIVAGPDGAPGEGGLADLPFQVLAARLASLVADASALESLPQRTGLLRSVRDAGLGTLVDDLAARQVPEVGVATELDLAWWSSVFEQVLAQDPALAGQDSAGLEALASRFRELDRRHVDSLAGRVRDDVRDHLGAALREQRTEAEQLFSELMGGRLTNVRDTSERYPRLVRRLRPCTIATPTSVPQLAAPSRTVDVVVLDSVQNTPVEHLLSAIARARQVVVLADPRTATGTAVSELADVLATVTLTPPPSPRDPGITGFLVDHGYEGLLEPAALPRYETLVHHDLVDGRGMPDEASGLVESTQAEVDRVVEIAIEHALTRPDESFGIVAATPVHAERIREALLQEVRRSPALAPFFSGTRPEPVVVTGLRDTAGLERDTVVITIGIGRTPHGRVLHRFGPLADDGADAMLLGAVAAARRSVRVVSCFESADLDPDRLRSPGHACCASCSRSSRPGAAPRTRC